MPKSKTISPKNNALKISLFILIGLLSILFLGFVSGVNQWTVKYVQCGEAPVVISANFMGSGSRQYPGDKEYGPGIFNHYECMSPAEKSGVRF